MGAGNGGEFVLSARQRRIVGRVQTQGFATIESLAQDFEVSAQTIRRDIIQLDAAGVLQRFHGGAGLPEPASGETGDDDSVRLGHARKSGVAAAAKAAIAEAVAARVPEGAAVFLDVGTTSEAVARALAGKRGLRIFTNSLKCAAVFAGSPTEVFVTGGSLGGADGSLVGEEVVASLERFVFDLAVLGCSGFEADGPDRVAVMDFDLRKVAVKQAALARARRAFLATDSSKFARSAIVRVAPLSAFAALITEVAPPARLARACARAKVELVAAEG